MDYPALFDVTVFAAIACTIFVVRRFSVIVLRNRRRAKLIGILNVQERQNADEEKFVVITRAGVVVDDTTRRAAIAYATEHELTALDLIPADLPAWRVRVLLDSLDIKDYRNNRIASGLTAGDAIVVEKEIFSRCEISLTPAPSLGKFIQQAKTIKRFAGTKTDFAIAPGLSTAKVSLPESRQMHKIYYGDAKYNELLPITILIIFFIVSPVVGVIGLVFKELELLLATINTPIRPAQLFRYSTVGIIEDLIKCIGPAESNREAKVSMDKLRFYFARRLSQGTDKFFNPPRKDCPLCQSEKIKCKIRSKDRYRHKPGRFQFWYCTDCNHVFLNPTLTEDGYEFYSNKRKSLSHNRLFKALSVNQRHYDRVAAITNLTEPKRWLNIGSGNSKLGGAARTVLPHLEFEGLDTDPKLEMAVKQGRVNYAHIGRLRQLAPQLQRENKSFDVISMVQYLALTTDPKAEIKAAARLLENGGYLLIETPNPLSKMGGLLGSYWFPWAQARNLHLLNAENLGKIMQENGITPIQWDFQSVHSNTDFLLFATFLTDVIAGPSEKPWLPKPGIVSKIRRQLFTAVLFPLLVTARLFDIVAQPLLRRPNWSNTYRVIGKKTETHAEEKAGSDYDQIKIPVQA